MENIAVDNFPNATESVDVVKELVVAIQDKSKDLGKVVTPEMLNMVVLAFQSANHHPEVSGTQGSLIFGRETLSI